MKDGMRKFSAVSLIGLGLSGGIFLLEPSIHPMTSVWMLFGAFIFAAHLILTDPQLVS